MRRIEELKAEELKELVKDYQSPSSVITVAKIIEKYDLDIKPQYIAKILPEQEVEDVCPYCNKKMFAKIKNRSEMDDSYCKECGHKNFNKNFRLYRQKKCNCNNCIELRQNELNKKIEILKTVYPKENNKRLFSDLSLKEKYNLITIIELSSSSYTYIYLGYKYYECSTAVKDLFEKRIISISYKSQIGAFDENKFPYRFYPSAVIFDVNVIFSMEEIQNIEDGLYLESISASPKEKYELFLEVMHKDILKKFEKMMNERGLGFEVLVNAEDEFRSLYDKLSYGQIITLCFCVARFYLDETKTGKIYKSAAKKGALKTVVTFYKNRLERGWSINNSEVSYAGDELKFFVEKILKKDIRILREVITVDDME